ncbi:hypothetical protein BJV74DRAFT_726272, partial [Russula compacta]
ILALILLTLHCNDWALAVANNALFWNCLIAIRPRTLHCDLLSVHEVGKYIHNKFFEWLKTLK